MKKKFTLAGSIHKPGGVAVLGTAAVLALTAQSQPVDSAQDYVNQQNFNVDAVRVEGFNSDLTIQTWDKDEVQLRVVNDDPDAPAFEASVQGNTLVITHGANSVNAESISVVTSGDGATSVVNVGGQGVVVTVNGVEVTNTVGESSSSPSPTLELSVPMSTNVDLRAFNGEASIEHLESSLSVAGNGEVEVGSIHNAQLAMLGNVSVDVAKASGDLVLSLEGNSDLEIGAGEINDLGFTASGNAGSTIEATAQSANFELSNNASVAISSVVERPTVALTNNADVEVGNWPDNN